MSTLTEPGCAALVEEGQYSARVGASTVLQMHSATAF